MLVVDDEDGPRTSIRMVFKNEFDVHTFDDGETALAHARQHPPDVAILDIRMAGLSGIEVLQGLKSIDPKIQVIMLTAYETLETAKQALRLGAADYLNKPFDLATIREAVAKAIRLRTVSEDIESAATRLQLLTDELQTAFSREEMARTATEIYAGVIHDLNNPLTIISGFVELLQNRLSEAHSVGGDDLSSIRENLNTISRQVNTCCSIAQRYLRFMRQMAKEAQHVSARQVLFDLETLLGNHPAMKQNRLVVDACNEEVAAVLNGTELIQVLLNLAVNALQSTSRPQTIRISATVHTEPLAPNRLLAGPGELFHGLDTFANEAPLVSFAIADEGCGIPRDVLPRIFEAYFTTKEPGKGTGLGLSIVARIVKTARGLVHVRTIPEHGTTMTVCLPARPLDAAAPARHDGAAVALT